MCDGGYAEASDEIRSFNYIATMLEILPVGIDQLWTSADEKSSMGV
jgi:hypothetical protein